MFVESLQCMFYASAIIYFSVSTFLKVKNKSTNISPPIATTIVNQQQQLENNLYSRLNEITRFK